MRLACSDASFRVLPWSSALDLILAMGIDRVSVSFMGGKRSHLAPETSFADIPATANAIQTQLARRSLALSWLQFARLVPAVPHINALDAEDRRRSRAFFDRVLELAQRASAPGITLPPGIVHPGVTLAQSVSVAVEELSWRGERARAAGVIFAFEATSSSIAHDPLLALEILQTCRGVGLTLDPSHFIASGHETEQLHRLLGHVVHVHGRGGQPGRIQAPMRVSTINWESLVSGLIRSGFEGDACLEYVWSTDMDGASARFDEIDVLGETLLLRDRLRAAIKGSDWTFPDRPESDLQV